MPKSYKTSNGGNPRIEKPLRPSTLYFDKMHENKVVAHILESLGELAKNQGYSRLKILSGTIFNE